MTRSTWATEEQDVWLKSRIAAFLDAHQKKTLSKEFFPVVVKEFRDKWPPGEPTAEEVADASSIEEANKIKRTKYDKVKLVVIVTGRITEIHAAVSGHELGSIITHAMCPPTQELGHEDSST
jgi:hypothetical protein